MLHVILSPFPVGRFQPRVDVVARCIRQPLLVALLVLFPTIVAAAPEASAVAVHASDVRTEGATGSLTGRVKNGITGRYLPNAQVTVEGTDVIGMTDETGTYRLLNVPAGQATLRVVFSGLDEQKLPVQVETGRSTELNVSLSSRAVAGDGGDAGTTIKLSEFVVASSRETDINSIATNEQRFAPNMKNVVATGSFGDVSEGNMGEFLKSLPGITTQYSEAEIISVSARGFASSQTTVSTDGAQMASANFQGSGRAFTFGTVSINNISRIELTKVPTAAMPADSIGGSINMITKSAFERSAAEFGYRLYLDGNSEDITLARRPDPLERKDYKVMPGFDFDFTWPISKDFGLVITGLSSNHYNPQHANRTQYNVSDNVAGSSYATPYFRLFNLRDGPRHAYRDSFGIKADWRVAPHAILSLSIQESYWYVYFGNNTLTSDVGTRSTPSIASGMPMTFDSRNVIGATGRGAVSMGGNFNTLSSVTGAAIATYRFDDGGWRVLANLNQSNSRTWFRNTGKGFFTSLTSTLNGPLRVEYRDITEGGPGEIRAYNNSNQAVAIDDITNYTLTTANSSIRDIRDALEGGDLSARHQVGFWGIPGALEVGSRYRSQVRDRRFQNINWTYNGPDGNPNTPDSAAPFISKVYSNQDADFGFKNLPWTSPNLAWEAFQANPQLFAKTPAQVVAENQFAIQNSERMKETVSALYLQGEARLLRNRINIVTGVRYERTTDRGVGPLNDPSLAYIKNPNGSFQLDAKGNRIRKPEAGAAGSLEELRLTWFERAAQAKRTYAGYYPSVNVMANLTENLLLRLAYAKTYARPDFTEIIPNTVINQNIQGDSAFDDPTSIHGTITVRNPALKPWTADNYDLSLEYYTREGGVISVGAFRKEIKDFFSDSVKLATANDLQSLGLDPGYAGWNISTTYNAGNATINGVEFNLRQSLQPLGSWLKPFTVFANGTKLVLKGERDADFSDFVPRTANWGFTVTLRPVTFMAKWNYRGEQRLGAFLPLGPDSRSFAEARTQLDLNMDVQLRKNLSFFASARNALNKPQVLLARGSATPTYASRLTFAEYGVQLSLGIKGRF